MPDRSHDKLLADIHEALCSISGLLLDLKTIANEEANRRRREEANEVRDEWAACREKVIAAERLRQPIVDEIREQFHSLLNPQGSEERECVRILSELLVEPVANSYDFHNCGDIKYDVVLVRQIAMEDFELERRWRTASVGKKLTPALEGMLARVPPKKAASARAKKSK